MPQMSSKLKNSPFRQEIAEVWKLFKEARLQMQEEKRQREEERQEARLQMQEEKRQREEERQEAKRRMQEERQEAKQRMQEERQEAKQRMQEEKRQREEERQEAKQQMQEEKRQREEERQEAKRQMQEEKRQRKEGKQEIDRLMKDNAIEMKKIQQSLKESKELFTGQWGALIESLVEGRLLSLLQQRGIDVQRTAQREEGLIVYKNKKGQKCEKRCEIDITAKNGTDVVAVEVKTTLTAKGVKRFLEVLKEFKEYFPEFKGKRVYGALAFLRHRGDALSLSEKSGLFLIKATGDSASIVNKAHFKPKVFS